MLAILQILLLGRSQGSFTSIGFKVFRSSWGLMANFSHFEKTLALKVFGFCLKGTAICKQFKVVLPTAAGVSI